MHDDPSEGLPEAIGFFVHRPGVLRARSPRRFDCLDRPHAAGGAHPRPTLEIRF